MESQINDAIFNETSHDDVLCRSHLLLLTHTFSKKSLPQLRMKSRRCFMSSCSFLYLVI